jgi:hypothetical protein
VEACVISMGKAYIACWGCVLLEDVFPLVVTKVSNTTGICTCVIYVFVVQGAFIIGWTILCG